MTTAFAIIVLLGALIFVHELGHFLVAKWAGVKVEVFSLGFGKKILRKKVGETEYCLSLFPLGGYVKMYGDDPTADLPEENRRRAFLAQPLGKRFAIVLAGPLFNLFFALFLYVFIPLIGEEVPVTKIATIAPESQADLVGLKPGDEIVEIDNQKVERLEDFERQLTARVSKPVRLKVQRGAEPTFFVEVRPREITGKDLFGDPKPASEIPGLSFTAPGTFVGVDSPTSWAAELGIQTGDMISEINGEPVHLWPYMEKKIQDHLGTKVKMTILKKDNGTPETVEATLPSDGQTGLFPLDLFIRELVKGGPAERANLLSGDHIVEVNGEKISSFDQFKDMVTRTGEAGGKLFVTVVREGTRLTVQVVPESREVENPVTHAKSRQWIIGLLASGSQAVPAAVRIVRITSPVKLVEESLSRTMDKTTMMLRGFWKLLTGQSSMKALGGPILIADLAGKTVKHGWVKFLDLMALISVNLFLINLFPVPILDGGHIFLFFTYEAVARRPMSIRWMERLNQVGFLMIMVLMLVTLVNDVSRYKPDLFPFLK